MAVNQELSSGDWKELGVFDLTPGSGTLVELTDDANEYVIADSVRLLRVCGTAARTSLVDDRMESTR